MTTLQVPDGTRYLLLTCAPTGDQTAVRAEWDDAQMDETMALEMVRLAADDLAQQAQKAIIQAARMRLMQPLMKAGSQEGTATTESGETYMTFKPDDSEHSYIPKVAQWKSASKSPIRAETTSEEQVAKNGD